MKKLVYSLIAVLVFVGSTVEARTNTGLDYEKTKKISKSYEVESNVKLDIKNTFGKVHINTWDKKTLTVDIEIIARMHNESRAQGLLDKIEVAIMESSSTISFETKLGNLKNRDREEFEINYTVNMPKKNPLRLKNSFGSNYLGDLAGDNEINISYGDLRFQNLTGTSDIKISFSDGTIRSIKKGEVEVKYSDVEIDEIEMAKFEQGFSDIEIRKAGTLDMTSKYGDVEIGVIKGIRGYVGYSEFSIDRLEVEMDLDASYSGGLTIDEVAKDFREVIIDAKFGDIRISFEEGANFRFDTEVSFSEFSYSGLPLEFDQKIKEDFKGRYKGKAGTGNGGYVRIESSYGDIRFR